MTKKPVHKNFVDRTGLVYGRLTVISYQGKDKNNNSLWLCKCSCGNTKTTRGNALSSGATKSCGCLKAIGRKPTHGMCKTSEYNIWAGMVARCNNPNKHNYYKYGGRGITVCKRWLKFENFYKDMGPRPTLKHEIDRKDNNKGYFPGNCRWATRSENNRNTRHNHLLTYKGETKCIAAWSEETGIHEGTLRTRIRKGWSPERVIETPPANTTAYK